MPLNFKSGKKYEYFVQTKDWRLEDENILESCLHQTVALYDNLDSNQTWKIATRRQL